MFFLCQKIIRSEDNEVIQFSNNFLEHIKNKYSVYNFFTPAFQQSYQKSPNQALLKIFNAQTIITEPSSLYSEQCFHRLDLLLDNSDKVRLFIYNCDGYPLINDVIELKAPKPTPTPNNLTLLCNMYLNGKDKYIGSVTITGDNYLVFEGTLDNLNDYKNKYLAMHVHQYGDLTNGCTSCGPHYNPLATFHGGVKGERHIGDLGNIYVNDSGKSKFKIKINVSEPSFLALFIGRSIVLHAKEDDLGKQSNIDSSLTGNSGDRIACGVIGIK